MLFLPLLYLLYISFNCQIYAQNKQCANCKYFIPHKNNKIVSLGLCRMFGNKVNSNNDNIKKSEKIIYNFAQHCRDDENLCGKNGSLYEDAITINLEPKKNDTAYNIPENKLSIMDDEMKKLINDYYKFLRNEPSW
jgi:hypothetical protein